MNFCSQDIHTQFIIYIIARERFPSPHFNSLRPSDAYMRQSTIHHWFIPWLVAWSAPSQYLNQCWNIVNWTLRNKLHWNFNRNSNIFIQENALRNVVCEMASILSRLQCVNNPRPSVSNTYASYDVWTPELQHSRRDKLAAIFQTPFSNAFSWRKHINFDYIYHWTLFPETGLVIFQH